MKSLIRFQLKTLNSADKLKLINLYNKYMIYVNLKNEDLIFYNKFFIIF